MKDSIFPTRAGLDRTRLGFTESVLSSFRFLTEDYNFRAVKTEATFVRYESPHVFANVYHGRASFQLGFEIGRLNDGGGKEEQPYSLNMIIEHMGAQQATGYTFLQASTQARVEELVPKLASLVKSYAAPFLTGEPHAFEQLLETRLRISDRLHEEMRVRDVRQKADEAWQSRDYVVLADLYGCILEHLTPAETKKLEYVKKRLPR